MDTNRMIKIEELEVGDEILIPKNCQLRYARVLRKPQLSKTPYKWRPHVIRWKRVRCVMKYKEEKYTYGDKNQYTHCTVSNPPDGDFPVIEESLDLNFKDIWLVKREGL